LRFLITIRDSPLAEDASHPDARTPPARSTPAGDDLRHTQPAPSEGGETLVVVPTFNEAENVEAVIEQVMHLPERIRLLVIDDGSPDGTADRVKEARERHPERLALIERRGKQGLGSAYLRGFRYALAHGCDYVCEMDADLSHDPADLPRLIAPVRAGEADLAIGSRYAGGVRVINWPLKRLVLSYGAGVYTRAITGLPVKDVTAGFKCYHRRVLEALDLNRIGSDGYSFQIEMKYRTWRAGFRVTEVPIIFTERTEGQSKMSRAIMREAALKVWELRARDLLGRL
jgi:dolichol-phosphate mannosyltransferase